MLRDVPGRCISLDDDLLVNTLVADDANHAGNETLDDIFGSAPSSPVLSGNDSDYAPVLAARGVELSDVPRLQSIHITNGYREGIAVSKEQYMQAGFDEGYSLGGEIGMKVGWCLGALEGIFQAARRMPEDTRAQTETEEPSAAHRTQNLLGQAQEALKMEKLLSPEFFGPDGIWLYHVPGQDDEGESHVTFGHVAASHPVLKKWRETAWDMAQSFGLNLE